MGAFLAILLLLVSAGAIAYVGDLIGRRLGKRRLTIFGLRPRHTAVLLTVISGALIALLTFLAAVISVPGFRQVVTQGERLAIQNLQLEARNAMQQQRAQRLVRENEQLAGSNSNLASENKKLQGENLRVGGLNRRLTVAAQELRKETSRLQAQSGAIQAENRRLAAQQKKLTDSNQGLLGRVKTLQTAAEELNARARGLRTEVSQLQEGRYLFARGEELSRVAFTLPPPEAQVQRRLEFMLGEAYDRLRTRAAGLRDAGLDRRLQLPRPGTAEAPRWASRQARVVMKKMAGQPLLLRLVAAENSVIDAPAPVKVELQADVNRLVYSEGAAIASRRIDGRGGNGLIFLELATLLQQAGAEARRAGIVPTQEGVGELQYELLLQTMDQVRRAQGPTTVTAAVKNDTRASGPLNLRLDVEPLPSAAAGVR